MTAHAYDRGLEAGWSLTDEKSIEAYSRSYLGIENDVSEVEFRQDSFVMKGKDDTRGNYKFPDNVKVQRRTRMGRKGKETERKTHKVHKK
jgi:hypothetical protein